MQKRISCELVTCVLPFSIPCPVEGLRVYCHLYRPCMTSFSPISQFLLFFSHKHPCICYFSNCCALKSDTKQLNIGNQLIRMRLPTSTDQSRNSFTSMMSSFYVIPCPTKLTIINQNHTLGKRQFLQPMMLGNLNIHM